MIYFIYLVMFYFSIIVFLRISYPELRWNWNLEKDKKLNFPKNFFWGTATASHQVEGNCKNNNWYNWENNFNSSFVNNLNKSATICKAPFLPSKVGPIRL